MLERLDVEFIETLLVVAPAAVVTEIAIMDVVPAVTVGTAPAGSIYFLEGLVVAAVAMRFGMDLAQFEIRLLVVERPYQPVIGVMA